MKKMSKEIMEKKLPVTIKNTFMRIQTPKKKEKTELKFSIYQKQVKAKFPTEIADIWL